MTEQQLIVVTADHIKQGQPLNGNACPIALAYKEATGIKVSVGVFSIRTYTRDGVGKEFIGELPSEAVRFIDDFDQGRPVEPFEFTLED